MNLSFLLNPELPVRYFPIPIDGEKSKNNTLKPKSTRKRQYSQLSDPSNSRAPFKLFKQRPGRTSTTIIDRQLPVKFASPLTEIHRTYSREFKINVLLWWKHGLVPDRFSPSQKMRSPTRQEVSNRYLVPMTTLWNWFQLEAQISIINSSRSTRTNRSGVRLCRWPEMEVLVYQAYQERRNNRKAVRRGWLRRQAILAFQISYPNIDITLFRFSNGWFFGFLSRHNITLRFTTNKSQKIPEDYLIVIIKWFQFNRRNSQVRPGSDDEQRVVGRYLLDSICNMDETPLPFEYLDGQTYANKGSHSIQVKTSRSGWDKRQATLVLGIFASGRPLVKPLILFKGAEKYDLTKKQGQIHQRKRDEEMIRYDSRVVVKWNPNAYANSDLLIEWIIEMLVPAFPSGPRMLVLDVAKFHKTDAVLDTLRSYNIIPSMIPASCTGLVQPLDVSVNKPLKDITRDLLDEALDIYENKYLKDLRDTLVSDKNAIAERRVLITECVGAAWERFCIDKKDLIVNTFRKLGISLPIDGSCDSELSVKGIESSQLEVGNWIRNDSEYPCEIENWGDIGSASDETQNCNISEVEISLEHDFNEAVDFVDK